MKTHTHSPSAISLGDLVATVSSFSANRLEALAAINDLFRRGRVIALTRQGRKRMKLA